MKRKAITTLAAHSLASKVVTVKPTRVFIVLPQPTLVIVPIRVIIPHVAYMIIDYHQI